MNCPICGKQLKEEYYHVSSYGVEEYLYKCENCNLYTEQFAYGNTELFIGDFMTGFGYNSNENIRQDKAIKTLCEFYKNNLDEVKSHE